MRLKRKKIGSAGAAAALAGVALFVAACGGGSGAQTTAANGSAAIGASSSATQSGGAAKSVEVRTTKGSAGTHLTDRSGRALYLWVADGNGMSNCSGSCAEEWPPLIAKGKPAAGSGVTAHSLGTIQRSDGTQQVTYNGHPLYTFVGDQGPGDVTGQGNDDFGALWWLVNPSGSAITSGGSSADAS